MLPNNSNRNIFFLSPRYVVKKDTTPKTMTTKAPLPPDKNKINSWNGNKRKHTIRYNFVFANGNLLYENTN